MVRLSLLSGMLCAVILSGCTTESGDLDRQRMSFGVANPRPESFFVCGSIGCENRVAVALSQAEWREVQAPFRKRPRNAGEERRALAEALRRIELIVGKKTGYDTDEAYSGLQLSSRSQDCVDEMVNASVFLELMDNAGHLRFHQQGRRVTLGMMTRRFWTHTVSTIFQRDTGQEFIIDTWAVKVGETPYIMDRTAWANNAPFRHDY